MKLPKKLESLNCQKPINGHGGREVFEFAFYADVYSEREGSDNPTLGNELGFHTVFPIVFKRTQSF